MKSMKRRVLSGFRVCVFNNCIEKNQNETHYVEYSENEGGGVEGRLKFFRKFIRFGSRTLPKEETQM